MLLLLLAEQLKNKVQQEKHINLSWIGMLSRTRDSKDSAVDNSGGDLAQWFLNLFQTNYAPMNPSHKLFSDQGYICYNYRNPGVIQESQNQIYKSKALEPSQTSADKEAVGKKSYSPCWTKNSPLADHFLCKMLESDVHDHQQSSHGFVYFVCRDSNINRPRSKLSAELSCNWHSNSSTSLRITRSFRNPGILRGQTSNPTFFHILPSKLVSESWWFTPPNFTETWPRDVKARGQRQERPICGIKITAWAIWEGPNMTQRTQPNNGNSARSSLEALSRTWKKIGCST